jgi:hypothetical protein
MVKYMKKQFLYKIFFVTAILTFGACNDPIFYTISLEEKILEPRIKGSPTNFVVFNGYMYVASGTELYKYEGTNPDTGRGIWDNSTISGVNSIFALAVTTDKLYALCAGSSGKGVLKVSDDGNIWSDAKGIENNIIINTIYAADKQLFIGAGKIGSYNILLYGGDSTRELKGPDNKMLNGAAYHDGFYYLSTNDLITEDGGGIYFIADGDLPSGKAELVAGSSNIPFVGIVNTYLGPNPVKAITRKGTVYTVTPVSISSTGTSMGNRLATGALAVWEGRLLLAGRQDMLGTSISSSYTNGYLELTINTGGETTGDFAEPGADDPSTVNKGDNGRYRSTIGKYPVNHIFQAEDGTLFVSTQKNGVWSYRSRNGDWNWNAED